MAEQLTPAAARTPAPGAMMAPIQVSGGAGQRGQRGQRGPGKAARATFQMGHECPAAGGGLWHGDGDAGGGPEGDCGAEGSKLDLLRLA